MNRKSGFTVIEILTVSVFLMIVAVVLFYQRLDIHAEKRDIVRKVSINAMYYNLEEVFYKQNGFYPEKIDENNLKALDPNLFTDPNGHKIGDKDSQYRYEPANCTNEKCQSYSLKANLEKESDYEKKSRN